MWQKKVTRSVRSKFHVTDVDILKHTALFFPQKGDGGGWANPFLLLFTTLALQYFLLLERGTAILSLRLRVRYKIPCRLNSSSQISGFPLRVSIHYTGQGTAIQGWTHKCMGQTRYSFTARLHKLPYLLGSVGSMCLVLTIMSSNCFIFTQAGFQPGSNLTAHAVIYIWILTMLNILY